MVWLLGLLLVVLGALGPILVHIRRHDFPNARRRRRAAVASAEAEAHAAVRAGPEASGSSAMDVRDGTVSGMRAPVRRRWSPYPATPAWWAHLLFAGILFAWFRVVFGHVVGAALGAGAVLLVLLCWPRGGRRVRPERFRRGRERDMPAAMRKTIDDTF